MENKHCIHCGQSSCSWKPDKDYENMEFDELEHAWLYSKQRVLGGWWIDYIPKCLVDKFHYIEEIYFRRDKERIELIERFEVIRA